MLAILAPFGRGTRADVAPYERCTGKLRNGWGRMHLYSYLDTSQNRALYADTYSVIVIQPRDGAALLKTGDCLGDMTSELKPCEYISEFVSGRAKNYAYQTHNTEIGAEATLYKVRGITLNYSASQLVKFERLKQIIFRVPRQIP